MEVKKNPKVNLEKQKTVYILFGLAVAFMLTLLAFEYAVRPEKVEELEAQAVDVEEEIIPITRQEDKPPPPPPPEPQKVTEVLEIVEDKVEIEDEIEIIDTEATEETIIEIAEPEEEEEEEAPIFFIVEDMPKFPGGELELRKYIAENVRYPAIARENDIQGKVYVRFAVMEDGSVDKVSVVRGVDPLLDEEAIRVVKTLPKWTPGKQRGKPVRVWYTVPINFQLQ